MKPIFQPSTIQRLKDIIASSTGISSGGSVEDTIQSLENELKSYADNKENKILIYVSSALLIIFAAVLIIQTKRSWPAMFIVVWLGAILYYRVTEKNLVNENLIKKSMIDPYDPLPKLAYLSSGIDLKIGRKNVLKGYLSLVLSSAVMLAHHLFVDSSVATNLFLLLGAVIASYFFWNYFYREDLEALQNMKNDIEQLKSSLLVGRYQSGEEE